MGSRSSFASRTTFESLQVDSGEENEEEEAILESTLIERSVKNVGVHHTRV
jgi:hypothetical protein